MKIEIEFVIEECANCHIIFGITDEFQSRLRNNHASFSCPQGHTQYYPSKTTEEKLRDQLKVEKDNKAKLEAKLSEFTKTVKPRKPRDEKESN